MLVTTTSTIAGYRIIETKGAVFGTRLLWTDIEIFRPIRGFRDEYGLFVEAPLPGEKPWHWGDSKELEDFYHNASQKCRSWAIEKMTGSAAALGANAVIDLRVESSLFNSQTFSREIVAYGTAVLVERIER